MKLYSPLLFYFICFFSFLTQCHTEKFILPSNQSSICAYIYKQVLSQEIFFNEYESLNQVIEDLEKVIFLLDEHKEKF